MEISSSSGRVPGAGDTQAPPPLSSFMDYRLYLHAFFLFRREQTKSSLRPYSWSNFSAAADLRSPNYLKMVIEGQRNLSLKMTERFAKVIGLQKMEAEEFTTLVLYNQATQPAERNAFLKSLNEIRLAKKMRSGEIRAEEWAKWPDWIGWVLYALCDQEGISPNPLEIKKILRDKVSLEDLRRSIRQLLDLGLITVNLKTGLWEKAKSLVDGADEIPVVLVRKLQSELMDLGLESLYRDPAEEREFGSLTMALTSEEFDELRFQLRKMRKQINKDQSIRRMNSKGQRVYQLNLQLFPVTDPIVLSQEGLKIKS